MPVTTPIPPEYIKTDGSPTREHWGTLRSSCSHFVHQLENSGSLEGHRTLIVHECLKVAAALGRYHRWQCQVNLQETSSENADWNKVPKISKDDFRHKYSPALTLLGNAQNLAFAHPKLLGRCYDNVYFCGRLIGDLPARGRPPTKDQSMKVYTQEYQEVVARVENSIDLTEESPSYSRSSYLPGQSGHNTPS